MDKLEIIKVIQNRDAAFISLFCQQGKFMGEGGQEILNLCRPVNVDEMLTFMHTWDATLLDIIENKI